MCAETIRLAGIMDDSLVDGPGVRITVFVQGCHKHCPGCQNPQTWDYSGGYERTVEELIAYAEETAIEKKITVSGGEPFDQPQAVGALLATLHGRGWHTMVYTGYTLETLPEEGRKLILPYADILVDGPFIEEQKSLDLLWRGSANQRILHRGKDY